MSGPEPHQETLFDEDVLKQLRAKSGSGQSNEDTFADLPTGMWAKEPVLLSDVAVGLISEEGLAFEVITHRLPNGETAQSHVPVKTIPGTAPSPHYVDLGGTIHRREDLSPAELRKARSIIVDVDTRVEYHTVILRPIHYHVVMVVSAMWANRYRRTGNRSPVLRITRAEIAAAAQCPNSRQFQRVIPEALYGMQGTIIERSWNYAPIAGIPTDVVSQARAMTIISEVEVEGFRLSDLAKETNDENLKRRTDGRKLIDGIPLGNRGGRARQIKITFTREFVEACISGSQEGRIRFDAAVRNLSIPRLSRYRGWKANAYRAVDQRLERSMVFREPFANLWVKLTGCPLHHLDDPAKMKDARSKMRQLLAEWEQEAYITWMDQDGYRSSDRGVHFLEKPYRTREADADGNPQSVEHRNGYWVVFARGGNYASGRPPTRIELWSAVVVMAGIDPEHARTYIERDIGFERIRAGFDVMTRMVTLMGDRMNRIQGPRWFNIDDVAQDDEEVVFRRMYNALVKATDVERADQLPLTELERARQVQFQAATAKVATWARDAGHAHPWSYLLALADGREKTTSATRKDISHWHGRVLDRLLDEANRTRDDYIGPQAHLRGDDAESEWQVLNDQALTIALRIAAEVAWGQHMGRQFRSAFGSISSRDWLTPPPEYVAYSRKILPAYPEVRSLIGTWLHSGERTSWENLVAQVLERRAIELHLERLALGLSVPSGTDEPPAKRAE